jgi:hypothetical protein
VNINIKVDGIDEVMKEFGKWTGQAYAKDIDKVSETYARKMAKESAEKAPIAPVNGGSLKASIASSPQAGEVLGEWTYGSDLPYARRQEYEHASKKGFIRTVVWNNRDKYREAVRKAVLDE